MATIEPPAPLDEAIREQALDAAIEEMKSISSADGEQILSKIDQHVGNMKVEESFVVDSQFVDTVNIYSTVDGTPSTVLVSMLSKVLRRRVPPDSNIPERFHGQRAFALKPPEDVPVRQKLLCWLHPDHPMREELDELGLTTATCRKANIPSEFEVQSHVQMKHKRTWATIEAHRSEIRQQQGIDAQMQQAEAMTTLAEELRGLLTETPRPTGRKASTK